MDIRTEYNEKVQRDIKDIRDKIYEREQMYFELAASARSDFEIMRIKTRMHNDSLLQMFYKQIQYIIEHAVSIYYVTVENDEERERMEELCGRSIRKR